MLILIIILAVLFIGALMFLSGLTNIAKFTTEHFEAKTRKLQQEQREREQS
jgi:hypothetical protein